MGASPAGLPAGSPVVRGLVARLGPVAQRAEEVRGLAEEGVRPSAGPDVAAET